MRTADIYVVPGEGFYVAVHDTEARVNPTFTATTRRPGLTLAKVDAIVEAVVNCEVGLGAGYVVRWLPAPQHSKYGVLVATAGVTP